MKTINKYIWLPLCTSLMISTMGCQDKSQDLNVDFKKYDVLKPANSDTDKWIKANLTDIYNIDVIWRWTDIESDKGYNIVPPYEENVVPFLTIYETVFLRSFTRVFEGQFENPESNKDFIRTYVPKQLHLIGSYSYNGDGTIKLGVAEGGRKITLYGINDWKDKSQVNRFLQTILHEFGHILHQNKLFASEFELITPNGYTAQWNNPTDNRTLRFKQAREQGFISDYARNNKNDDFVDLFAYYLLTPDAEWQKILSDIDGHATADPIYKKDIDDLNKLISNANTPDEQKPALQNQLNVLTAQRDAKAQEVANTARTNILAKKRILTEYLKTQWSMDIEVLKAIVQEQLQEAYEIVAQG